MVETMVLFWIRLSAAVGWRKSSPSHLEPGKMQIETTERAACTVVHLREPTLGAANYHEFKSEITKLANAGKIRLILDFGTVEMVDSSGLGALISVIKTVGRDGRVALVEVKPKVASIFRITRLEKHFPIYGSEADAEAALG